MSKIFGVVLTQYALRVDVGAVESDGSIIAMLWGNVLLPWLYVACKTC